MCLLRKLALGASWSCCVSHPKDVVYGHRPLRVSRGGPAPDFEEELSAIIHIWGVGRVAGPLPFSLPPEGAQGILPGTHFETRNEPSRGSSQGLILRPKTSPQGIHLDTGTEPEMSRRVS